MNRIASLVVVLALLSGCASQTVIRSVPSGATVRDQYGDVVGKTPYVHRDQKTWGHEERFTLEMEGYEKRVVRISRDDPSVGKLLGFGVGGIFFFPLWAGLLWGADYEPSYKFKLKEAGDLNATEESYVRAQ